MRIDIPEEILKQFKIACKGNPAVQELEGWRHSEIDTKFLSEKEIDKLFKLVEDHKQNHSLKKLSIKLKHFKQALTAKTKRIKRLEALTEALITEIAKYPNHRIYKEDDNGHLLPYYVREIQFHPYEARTESPACISVTLSYFLRGDLDRDKIHIQRSDIPAKGVTVNELIINVMDVIPESDELNLAHLNLVDTYKKYRDDMGEQYYGTGSFETLGSSWSSANLESVSGFRLVIEDDIDYGKHGSMITNDFWDKTDDEEHVQVPIHPIIRAFDLGTHEFVAAHVSQIEPYKYDTKLSEKLVLDDSKKNMIDLLVTVEDEEGGDIIKGKSGGIIILSSGEPGTGKTLTAEVYAEATKKALYCVQCSQLGTDPEKLEEKLREVLDRATRWGVVLLIDEADVYIHERGSDLEQNAIVGVFLRLLEYYNGILFLTTNRETIVDDAIISRITAHVRYKLPESDQQREIWNIMTAQYKLKLSAAEIKMLLKTFPKISGRTIKQLVRLVKVMSMKDNKAKLMDMFKEAAKYQTLMT